MINIGSNFEYSITDYAKIIMDVLKYKCKIVYDKSKPDGVKEKLDNSLLKKIGWNKKANLKNNILKTYESFLKTYNSDV